MILLLLLIVSLMLFLIYFIKWYHMKYKYFQTGLHKYRGPRSCPIIGHGWLSLFLDPSGYLDYVIKSCRKYNDNLVLYFFLKPSIITSDYNLIELIVNGNVQTRKSYLYKFLYNWLSTGLLTSYGEKWRNRRKMITPAFHFQIIEQFVDVFHVASDTLVDELSKEVRDETKTLNIYDYISLCTLDIICETAMGTKINAQVIKESSYISSVKHMGYLLLKRVCSPIHHLDLTYRFTPEFKKEKECLGILHEHTDSIIKARRRELMDNENSYTRINDEGFGLKRKHALLDILLQSTTDGKPLSNEDIREEVDTFMFEGHDTTAAGISFALFMIAKYPIVQRKIFEEQLRLFGNERSRPASCNDLNNMRYLEMVIKETLRLYPPVPLMGREILEDFEYDGMVFRKGLDILIFSFGLHRNPIYFPDPETFNPERFAKDSYLVKYPYAYIPFAAGHRNCIGQRFAMLEMKATISKMIRYFELSPAVPEHHLQLAPEIVLRSLTGVPIQVRCRNNFS